MIKQPYIDDQEFKIPENYTDEEKAGADALEACYKYWKLYTKRKREDGIHNTAVIWIQDNRTGHMMCFTRGEYGQDLVECIENLNKLSNHFHT